MPSPPPNLADAHSRLSQVAQRLGRRWLARVIAATVSAVAFGASLGTLAGTGLGWPAGAVGTVALFCAAAAAILLHWRCPDLRRRPGLAEAALLAETAPSATGATPLLLRDACHELHLPAALRAIDSLERRVWPSAVTVPARLALTASLLAFGGAVALTVITHNPSQSPTLTATAAPRPVRTNQPSATRPAAAPDQLSASALADLRDRLLSASPVDRQAAAERYAALWERVAKVANPPGADAGSAGDSPAGTASATRQLGQRLRAVAGASPSDSQAGASLAVAAAEASALLRQQPGELAGPYAHLDWANRATALLDRIAEAGRSVQVAAGADNRDGPSSGTADSQFAGAPGGGESQTTSITPATITLPSPESGTPQPSRALSPSRSNAAAASARYLAALARGE